ncbi:hypothetical protein LCGC14_1736940 [marine sediment metagenome]|uniref:Uncharacterized protein n=1 Tax=marine sediment metagenome TaxID=412755 RepID=A0A0F9H7V2_9ZZZZ
MRLEDIKRILMDGHWGEACEDNIDAAIVHLDCVIQNMKDAGIPKGMTRPIQSCED